MKFFFPDSQDLIDPSFDFETETRSEFRIRQRDDVYAHEVFAKPPYDGLLISKAIVEGKGASGGRYTLAQRHRLLRVGVRNFFRLGNSRLETMGDCGAFSYIREEYPPFSVNEVIDFYSECRFDYGASVDHVILAYQPDLDHNLLGLDFVPSEYRRRQVITLESADEFLRLHQAWHCHFTPVGVAQGWSPSSYTIAVEALQAMGYRLIALGGMVPLKTHELLDCLERVNTVRHPDTRLHLFGVTRCEQIARFIRFGVISFDSTSPLRQAFKDDKDNYYMMDRTYMALRVPQVEGNAALKRRIAAGQIDQDHAQRLEQACLQALTRYDFERTSLNEVLEALRAYECLYDGKRDRTDAYREVLSDRPWKRCSCDICKQIGIHVILFRGTERNKRRGFHNLFVFSQKLRRELGLPEGVDS